METSQVTERRSSPVLRTVATNRKMWKLVIYGILTLGIYPLVIWTMMTDDLNMIATPHDGKKTMHYCLLAFLVGIITLGIGFLVWNHNFANRLGDEARRRGISTNLSASSFWLWDFLGSLIIVGPFVYMHKVCETIDALGENYNQFG